MVLWSFGDGVLIPSIILNFDVLRSSIDVVFLDSYLVLNEAGSPDTSWWNNNGSVPGYVDFTNPEAAEWWYQRVKNVIDTYDIESLKFDAGESSFTPQVSVQLFMMVLANLSMTDGLSLLGLMRDKCTQKSIKGK